MQKIKKFKKVLAKNDNLIYTIIVLAGERAVKNNDGLSPNGKALDSDSSISRFESL